MERIPKEDFKSDVSDAVIELWRLVEGKEEVKGLRGWRNFAARNRGLR